VKRRRIQPKPTDELETVSLRLPAQSVRVVCEVPRGQHRPDLRDHPGHRDRLSAGRGLRDDTARQGRRPGSQRPPRHASAAVPTDLQSTLSPAAARPAPLASFRTAPVFTTALSATPGGPFFFPRR